MSENNKTTVINYRIAGIKLVKYFENESKSIDTSKELKESSFALGINFKVEDEKNLVSIILECTFKENPNDKDNLFGIRTSSQFQIKDLDNFRRSADRTKFDLPYAFIKDISGQALSHMRGILAVSTSPVYKNINIPLIDIDELLKRAKVPLGESSSS